MKSLLRIILIVSFVTAEGNLLSQNIRPKGSLQFNVGLPINLQNEAFKGIMQGLFSTSFHYQHTLKNGFSLGGGLNYTYFEINEFKVSEDIFGGMHIPAVFGKIAHERIHSQSFGTDIGLKFGFSQTNIVSNLNREKGINPVILNAAYIEPALGLILLSDEEMAFKFQFALGFYGFDFSPYLLGLNSNEGFDPKKFTKTTIFLSVGIAYVHYFRMH